RPGKFEVDDEPAPPVKVEPFACGIGGEEEALLSMREPPGCRVPLAERHPTVQLRRVWPKNCGQSLQGGSILREHDGRLAGASQEAEKRRDLAFAAAGVREGEQVPQQVQLRRAIGQGWRLEFRGRLVVIVSGAIKRKAELR